MTVQEDPFLLWRVCTKTPPLLGKWIRVSGHGGSCSVHPTVRGMKTVHLVLADRVREEGRAETVCHRIIKATTRPKGYVTCCDCGSIIAQWRREEMANANGEGPS